MGSRRPAGAARAVKHARPPHCWMSSAVAREAGDSGSRLRTGRAKEENGLFSIESPPPLQDNAIWNEEEADEHFRWNPRLVVEDWLA